MRYGFAPGTPLSISRSTRYSFESSDLIPLVHDRNGYRCALRQHILGHDVFIPYSLLVLARFIEPLPYQQSSANMSSQSTTLLRVARSRPSSLKTRASLQKARSLATAGAYKLPDPYNEANVRVSSLQRAQMLTPLSYIMPRIPRNATPSLER